MNILYRRPLQRLINKIYSVFTGVNIIDHNSALTCHKTAKISGATIFGKVNIGERSKIERGVSLNGGKLIEIGRYTNINGPNTGVFSGVYPITIGNFCSIANNVTIQEYNHKMYKITTYFINKNIFKDKTFPTEIYSKGSITIGNDVWVGAQCVILSGTTIGDGAVIAANSVVSGYVPPYAIVGGTPAKILKFRFEKEIVESLLKIKWWDWEVERLRATRELFKEDITREVLRKYL